MKKVSLVILALLFSYCCYSQQIERLSPEEISGNETPRAAAYHFVTDIVEENYPDAVELMSLEMFFNMMPLLIEEGVPIDQVFSTDYIHKIVDMRPVVKMGYSVVVTGVKDIDSGTFFNEGSSYREAPAFRISLNCANANDELYDGSKGDYDTTVDVIIVKEDNEWKVFGFE